MARRVVTVLVALLVAAGCVLAGVWQWSRHQDRVDTAALVGTNFDADPVPVADVLTPDLADDDVWRPVRVVGRYVGDPVLLRGRPVDGSPAVHELGVVEIVEGPLAGATLVVNRGWLPLAPDEGLPELPPRPGGTVEVVARLRPLEAATGREASRGETYRVATEDLERAGLDETGAARLGAYGVLVTEGGSAPDDLSPLPRPEVTVGVNLSYAFQWWLFAVGALVGGVLLLRQSATPTAPGGQGAADPRPRPPARRPSAEEEEDAIVDAQEAAAAAPPDRRVGR